MRDGQIILLLENDEVDVMAIKRTLVELGISNKIEVVSNGDEGLKWLNANGHNLPSLILLDINMPVMNGLEFLDAIKADKAKKKIPVVALTSSRDEKDKVQAFEFGIAGYMVKPVDPTKYFSVMKTIVTYWNTSELPF